MGSIFTIPEQIFTWTLEQIGLFTDPKVKFINAPTATSVAKLSDEIVTIVDETVTKQSTGVVFVRLGRHPMLIGTLIERTKERLELPGRVHYFTSILLRGRRVLVFKHPDISDRLASEVVRITDGISLAKP